MHDQLKHLQKNYLRYRMIVEWNPHRPHEAPRFLDLIRNLRAETNCGLKDAKDAMDAWKATGCRGEAMSIEEAKILLRNLLLRGNCTTLTLLEIEAIKRLSE